MTQRHRVEPPDPTRSGKRLVLLKALRAAESLEASANCAVAAAKRARDKADANWQYVREQAANPHRLAQLSTDEQWAEFDRKHQSEMEASGSRRVATVRAVGDAEVAYHWLNHEAKEARIELCAGWDNTRDFGLYYV